MTIKNIRDIINCGKIHRVLLLLIALVSISNAQLIFASAHPDSVTVGDEISLRIAVQTPAGVQIIPPDTEKEFGNFIVRDSRSQTRNGEDFDTTVYNYTVAIYKPQNCTIPALPFLLNANDSFTDTLYTQSIPINIISVLPQSEGEEGGELAIRDLKAQQVTGKRGSGWILWVLIAALMGATAFYIFRRFTKNKGKEVLTVPPKPAYEEAMEALLKLEAQKLIQKGFIKEHVFELSEIFKRYIGRRFEVNALEFTTDEMVAWLESSKLTKDLRFNAEWFFRTSDPIKFARLIPDSQTLQKFDSEVRKFIEATKPLPEIQDTADTQSKTKKMGCVTS